ncbi:hypothetical protein [Lysinibacillus sphaericus]|uniref:hypothetical protein n=1 Tax=Lysinibacillus sphaericus TaxID=1421 RepID=UPI00211E2D03|nr:hypothetical protein [Lysinibacillus sphaericus]
MVYPRLAPEDFNSQFRPGMKIWVTLPTGTYSGTLIRTFGTGGRTAEIQLDNGQIVTVDVSQITAAGTGAPPGNSYPPPYPPPYPTPYPPPYPTPYPPQPYPPRPYPPQPYPPRPYPPRPYPPQPYPPQPYPPQPPRPYPPFPGGQFPGFPPPLLPGLPNIMPGIIGNPRQP